ncbi:PrsW family intramembrane metalloprotease [Naumannella halotolerans]|uniref:RsiW-degrading membrane proteinase PrsW (M82 family) n=1 Tax=Naumannella halotolerans TaxID=993414 RepID=A0A4R7J964_9ACTN|nr:PrsW family intramembrane metalloprotease [Naumannella halotolerans]TDT34051.1 RsiW-degrading membrane proteinase PrsW (M82 family) [Naumannella halotolerans]
MSSDPAVKERQRSGLPPDRSDVPFPKRVLTDRLTWIYLGLLVVSLIGLWALVQQVVPTRDALVCRDTEAGSDRVVGIGDFWEMAFRFAWPTAAVLVLLFLLAGRWRPRPFASIVCLAWGAGAATYASLMINTCATAYLSIAGAGDPQTAPRAAIFVAPFVEEATKGTVLFLLAVFARNLWVNRLNGLVLGALSGVGFAFIENMIYYGRVGFAARETIGAAPPEQAMAELAQMRGLMLAFAHPLFTMMIGLGIAIGIRAKSKLVRVMAPLVGFVVAVLLHMIFNSVASLSQAGAQQTLIYIFGYWGLVVTMTIFAIRQLFRESKLVRARLTDYARTGQLQAGDPVVMSSLRKRFVGFFHAVLTRRVAATWRLQRAMIELAYLRDAMTRGLVDGAGHERERELLAVIAQNRPQAVVEPFTKTPWPRLPGRRRRAQVSNAPMLGGRPAEPHLGPQFAPPDAGRQPTGTHSPYISSGR